MLFSKAYLKEKEELTEDMNRCKSGLERAKILNEIDIAVDYQRMICSYEAILENLERMNKNMVGRLIYTFVTRGE